MIEELSVQFPLQECCVAMSVSRSGYYQWLGAEQSARAEANAELLKEIRRVYDEHKGRYGSPRVTQQLRQEGLSCGENRVARLMRENDLAARAKKAFRPRTTTASKAAAPNLIKELQPSAPDQVSRQRYHLYRHLGGMALSGGDPGSIQPQSSGLEARSDAGVRTGCYCAQECVGFASTATGPVLSLRSRQPVQQPSGA
jgi:putative transposase